MKRLVLFALAAMLAPAFAADPIPPQAAVVSHWVQLGPEGAEARVVTGGGHCPSVLIDGQATAMTVRGTASADFSLLVCTLLLPATAKTASVEGHPLALPVARPQRILVLGDTGCRIKGTLVQACNDPKAWPFAGLSRAAAAQHPDLIIHLGDYLYRESPCPAGNAGCAGSPYGDNWPSWAADFFTPAAPLLEAAPWIVIRGNHEDCNRAGAGFIRLLGPLDADPSAPCPNHLAPYPVQAGSQTVAVMDSADASDAPLDAAAVPLYVKDFEALKAMANIGTGRELWLATHRPIWGVITFMGAPAGGNATMIKAAGDLSVFGAISLMLSGHIHTFEEINYVAKIPPQIVAGHGGDLLDQTPVDLVGTTFQGESGVAVKSGSSVGGFGFLMLTRDPGNDGWTIQLYDSQGAPIRTCAFASHAIFCMTAR